MREKSSSSPPVPWAAFASKPGQKSASATSSRSSAGKARVAGLGPAGPAANIVRAYRHPPSGDRILSAAEVHHRKHEVPCGYRARSWLRPFLLGIREEILKHSDSRENLEGL